MIPSEYFWINTFIIAIGTLAIRFSFIGLSTKIQISEQTKILFSYIPAAVLPALMAPMVFFHEGNIEPLYGKERLFIFAFAALVAFRWKSMVKTILFGLIALYILTQAL